MEIPTYLEDISPEWIRKTLSSTGLYVPITAIQREQLTIEGQGFTGQIARFQLLYDTPAADAADSIVIKMPNPNPQTRNPVIFQREVNFYQNLAQLSTIRIPRCYYSAFDEQTGNSVLLLEDFQEGSTGNMLEGCTAKVAERAIEEIAPFHAAWWDNPALDSVGGFTVYPLLDTPAALGSWRQNMNDSWHSFSRQFPELITAPIREAWPLLVQHGDEIRRQALTPPLTLCHGDYHLDNLFFTAADNRSLVVLDWQAIRLMPGALDLSYFMIWNLEPDLRRSVERNLLKKYCAALKRHGVERYDLDQCYRDYRIALYELILPRLIIVNALNDTSSKQAQALVAAMATRTSEAMIDHPITDLLQ